MIALAAFVAGTLAGILVMCIVAASGDDSTSTAQGPMTPPEQSEEVAI